MASLPGDIYVAKKLQATFDEIPHKMRWFPDIFLSNLSLDVWFWVIVLKILI